MISVFNDSVPFREDIAERNISDRDEMPFAGVLADPRTEQLTSPVDTFREHGFTFTAILKMTIFFWLSSILLSGIVATFGGFVFFILLMLGVAAAGGVK